MPDPGKGQMSPGEVATLLEEIKPEFRAVTEVILPLREDMRDVKERLTTLEIEVRTLKDAVQIALPNHEKRLSRLEKKVGV